MRLAVDVMGGDHGCAVVVRGLKQALSNGLEVTQVLLVGNQQDIESELRRASLSDSRIQVIHASEVLTMDDKPLEGIRKKKDSSMVRAIEQVRHGKADAVISPGNTG
ncbi:MAG: hypothetical protein RLY20_2811, partial [Verrucomicrobiota bacterium]